MSEQREQRWQRTALAGMVFMLGFSSLCAGKDGPSPTAKDVDADTLVRAVRDNVDWIHRVKSFRMKADLRVTRSAQAIEAERHRLKIFAPDADPDPNTRPQLRRERRGVLEIAFDPRRVRYLEEWDDSLRTLAVWDGKVSITCRQDNSPEHYWLDDKPPDNLKTQQPFVALRWLREADHTVFPWRHRTLVDKNAAQSPPTSPGVFRYLQQKRFRGADCHMLVGLDGSRLYLHVENGRLAGVTTFWMGDSLQALNAQGHFFNSMAEVSQWIKGLPEEEQLNFSRKWLGLLEDQEGLPQSECWFSDYRELTTGCAYPMKQGYVQYLPDEDGEAHPGLRCDIAVTEAEVDGKLPEGLFSIRLKEGVAVTDGRYQPPLEYRHKADRTVEEWNTIVEEAKRLEREQLDRETARDALIGKPAPKLVATTWLNSKPLTWDDLAGKVVVLNFGAIDCPACLGGLPHMQSWHDGRERIGSLVIWVHAYSDDVEAIRVFLRKHEYTFPVCVDAKPVASTMLQGPTFDRYGMWGMPHAFVVDQKGRIAAHGFGIDRHPVGPKAVELVRKPPN